MLMRVRRPRPSGRLGIVQVRDLGVIFLSICPKTKSKNASNESSHGGEFQCKISHYPHRMERVMAACQLEASFSFRLIQISV